jgi:hypothetical protein
VNRGILIMLIVCWASFLLLLPASCQSSTVMCDVLISSQDKKGYDVYLDGISLGKEGQVGDKLDGNYRFFLTGNLQHTVAVDDGKSTYGLKNFYFNASVPYFIAIDSPEMKLGPSQMFRTPSTGQASKDNMTLMKEKAIFAARNQPPDLFSLIPSQQSPQSAGVIVTWKAQAKDPETDPLLYRFLMRGPGTGGKWQIVQDWSQRSNWSWISADKDIGTSEVSVLVRDGKHAGPLDLDDFANATGYVISLRRTSTLNLNIANDVYTDKDRKIYYCQDGSMFLVKNRIYLTGPDVRKVKKVKYILHPSFSNPEQVAENPVNNFEIWIMTWGRFPLTAIITTKDGQEFNKTYQFAFKSKVEDARKKGIPLVRQCE